MNTAVRALLTFLFFITGCYIIFWIPFSIIPGAHTIPAIPISVSLVLATITGILVWKKIRVAFGNSSGNSWNYILLGGIVVGAIGFIFGFIGPMIVRPFSYLGPLLGLFFTGPAGFFIGMALGFLYWRIKIKK